VARHPRWRFHFTPTSASWLNAVEGFFATLTRQRLKRGVFRSVVDLQVAINRFVADTNADPKPCVWTADPKRVLAAVKRGKQTREANVRVSPLAALRIRSIAVVQRYAAIECRQDFGEVSHFLDTMLVQPGLKRSAPTDSRSQAAGDGNRIAPRNERYACLY
jgi:hypothetical protein